jgi:hypothetical protein
VTPSTSRWLAPIGASAAVLAVFVVPGVLASSGGGGGDNLGPDRMFVPNEPVTPHLPSGGAEANRRGTRDVEIIGYQAMGRTLRIFYTVDQSTDCSSRINPPDVEERVSSVVVELSRQRSRAPDQVCQRLRLTNSVEITLSEPMGGRLLQDGSRGGALVPIERPFRSDVTDTIRPPDSRAGR